MQARHNSTAGPKAGTTDSSSGNSLQILLVIFIMWLPQLTPPTAM